MLKTAPRMKFVLVVLVLYLHNVQLATVESNFTIPQPLLTSITNFIINNYANESITFGDILFSDITQDILNTYGYEDVAGAITNLDGSLDVSNQIGQLQQVVDQLAAVDNICFHQLLLFVGALNRMDRWALQMFDATSKIQPGILEGNTMHVGNFDECLKIDVVANESQINGQYCSSFITDTIEDVPIIPSLKDDLLLIKQSYGFCVPAACDRASLEAVARLLEQALNSSIHFYFADHLCMSTVKTKPFSTKAIISITFFSAVGLVAVFSTIYDVYFFKKQNHHGASLLIAFSFYTNGRKLLSTKKSADSLGCLNGMKVISIMWIILAHRYMYSLFKPMINLLDVVKWESDSTSGLVTGGNMAVDTFFLISGLLIVYVYLLHKEKGQDVPLVMFYVHRILRLTPALAAMVLLYSTLLDYIGTGPFWPFLSTVWQADCAKNWWWTLLYIQNFVAGNSMCVSQSWYLAVDTQLYFVSPLLLVPLLKWPKRTLTAVMGLIVVCCSLAFSISWQNNYTPAFTGITDDVMNDLYAATQVRAPAWLAGFLLGYVLFKIRNRRVRMSKVVLVLLWTSSLSVTIGILAYHKRLADLLYDPARLECALDNSLLRLAWAVAVGVIIFLCVTGYGGPVNKFLSHSIFTVLIRINYNVYLTHMLVIVYSLGNVHTPVYGSHLDNLYYFWGDYIISSLIACVWTLCFESPIITLEKLMLAKPKSKKENPVVAERYNNNVSVVVIENNLENHEKLNNIGSSSTE